MEKGIAGLVWPPGSRSCSLSGRIEEIRNASRRVGAQNLLKIIGNDPCCLEQARLIIGMSANDGIAMQNEGGS